MALSLLCHCSFNSAEMFFCLILIYNLPYLLVSRPFYHDHLLGIFSSGGCPPLILRPNLSRKGQKKLFIDRPPQLSQSLDDRPPSPLCEGPDPPLNSTLASSVFSAVIRFHDSVGNTTDRPLSL